MIDQRLEKSILRTVGYADIFNYPLSGEEIWYWLTPDDRNGGSKKYSRIRVSAGLKRLLATKQLKFSRGFYGFGNLSYRVSEREKKAKWSDRKLALANKICRWLRLIPTIEMVAVTGSVAINNAQEDDDIDLMVVTAADRLWITRILCVGLLELFGVRRRPQAQTWGQVKNKLCLNLFFDVNHLTLSEGQRDLYYAHEIMQVQPIWDRRNCYNCFLRANYWVKDWLPNAGRPANKGRQIVKKRKPTYYSVADKTLKLLEYWARELQWRYMSPRMTREVVTDYTAHFHPFDFHGWVMKKYDSKLLQRLKHYDDNLG